MLPGKFAILIQTVLRVLKAMINPVAISLNDRYASTGM